LPSTTSSEDAIRAISKLRPKALSLYPTYLVKLCERAIHQSHERRSIQAFWCSNPG
jgi:hypothetical protein